MRVYLKNYRQSPRKVRLVADLIRGKSVPQALMLLRATPKRATVQFEKTLQSALANAKQKGMTEAETLKVAEVRVDKGLTLHRVLPRAQGRATRYDKHSSNIILVLSEVKKTETKETAAKKPVAKKRAAKKKSS